MSLDPGDARGGEAPDGVAATAAGNRWAPVLGRATQAARQFLVLLRLLLRWALRLALPVAGAAGVLHALPYHATVQGIPFVVEGSVLALPGLSADTTLGSWEFPDLTGVPIGVHIRPENVNVLDLTRAANGDLPSFVTRLQADFAAQVPRIVTWLVAEVVVGILLGLLAAASLNMSVRYLRGHPRRAHELRIRAIQLGAAVAVVLVVAGYGRLSYNPRWAEQSRLTGTLAAAQLFPDQLSAYYSHQTKAFDVLGSVLGVQAVLQKQLDDEKIPETTLQIMFISDMHLAGNYPLVQRYAASYGVDLIINTGDESEFGTALELTPAYLSALRAVTATTPMLWLAGNHDSPDVEATMRSIPGVTVLGTKTATADGYAVRAGVVQAFGLTVAGVPDPRVYGGPGAYGADALSVTDPLERSAVDQAVAGVVAQASASAAARTAAASSAGGSGTPAGSASSAAPGTGSGPQSFDIFATHEPVAAEELRAQLPGRIRQTNSGHTHKQNPAADLQSDSGIDLVEGSTGAGGLDNLVRGAKRPPIELSIESVGADCQFSRIIRFQIDSTAPSESNAGSSPQAYGNDVVASTTYFRPQKLAAGRVCDTTLGIGKEAPL